jgi:hypothetical protein
VVVALEIVQDLVQQVALVVVQPILLALLELAVQEIKVDLHHLKEIMVVLGQAMSLLMPLLVAVELVL